MASDADDAVRRDGAALAALTAAARERILILDGAMGTQIQGLGFHEEQFRGHRFHACDCHQQGNNDLLILTQPDAVEEIHYRYAIAGADIIETNTFSSTAIAQADYGMRGDGPRAEPRGRAAGARRRPTAPRPRTAAAASSPARSGRPTAPPRSRPTSTTPASAPSASTTCASPTASSCAG